MEVLLNSFHLNGHTLGIHQPTQKLQSRLLTQEMYGNRQREFVSRSVLNREEQNVTAVE